MMVPGATPPFPIKQLWILHLLAKLSTCVSIANWLHSLSHSFAIAIALTLPLFLWPKSPSPSHTGGQEQKILTRRNYEELPNINVCWLGIEWLCDSPTFG